MRGILNRKKDNFFKMLILSFILHAALFGALAAIKEKKELLTVPSYTVELVDAAGIVKSEVKKPEPRKIIHPGVPDTAQKKEKKTKELTLKKPLPEKKQTIFKTVKKPEKTLQKKEEDKLIEERIRELEKKSAKKDALKKELKDIKEEILSSETASGVVEVETSAVKTGSVKKELFEIKFKEYYNMVGNIIKSEWIYPKEAREDLEAWLSVKIFPSGEVKEIKMEKRSGSALFDESAIRAVKKSSPFPPPPSGLVEKETLEIGVRFCPGGCKK